MASSSDDFKKAASTLDPLEAADLYLSILYRDLKIGPVQRSEVVKAFMGGVAWLMTVQMEYIANLSDEDGAAKMKEIHNKVLAYAMSLVDNGKGGMTNEEVVPNNVKPN